MHNVQHTVSISCSNAILHFLLHSCNALDCVSVCASHRSFNLDFILHNSLFDLVDIFQSFFVTQLYIAFLSLKSRNHSPYFFSLIGIFLSSLHSLFHFLLHITLTIFTITSSSYSPHYLTFFFVLIFFIFIYISAHFSFPIQMRTPRHHTE